VHCLTQRNADLGSKAFRLIDESPRLLEYTISTFPSGTDHTQRHTLIVERIGRMLLTDAFLAELSDEELFFLAVACHYHDLAMAGAEEDDRTAETREQVRRDHAVRIGKLIATKWAELGFDTPRVAQILGEICRGHRPKKDGDGKADWNELNALEILGPATAVRVRLVSALVYAIDELHLGADRAPERVQNWRNIKDEESRRHWRRHQAVSGPTLHGGAMQFQVSADTPEFEENLRTQVFRKACSAVRDLRDQALIEGVKSGIPGVSVHWQRNSIWELLLPICCADLVPRDRLAIELAILNRFKQSLGNRMEMTDVCLEKGNADEELAASVSRAVGDAKLRNELVASGETGELRLSTSETCAEAFLERARNADGTDELFVGRFRRSWEDELFRSEFGRSYVRNWVFPTVERSYSVILSQRPEADPTRTLLESFPTAARLVREFATPSNILVKDRLLAHAAMTGALIELHADPDRILDKHIRVATRQLAKSDESTIQLIRLLEELALVGGLSYEQMAAAVIPSEAAIKSETATSLPGGESISMHLTQSIPEKAPPTSHLPSLLLASKRAGATISIMEAKEFDLKIRLEGTGELPSGKPLVLQVSPGVLSPPASFRVAARVEVNRTTRVVRFYIRPFSSTVPTSCPIIVSLPRPKQSPEAGRVDVRFSVQWPELTVRDLKTLDAANHLLGDPAMRIELLDEGSDRVLGSMANPSAHVIFPLEQFQGSISKGLRGLENSLPAPVLLPRNEMTRAAELTPSERAARWQALRNRDRADVPRFSAIFLRLTNAEGRPFDERFLAYLPFQLFNPPTFKDEADPSPLGDWRQKWVDADDDFILTSYFVEDIHELSKLIENWCKTPEENFPVKFSGDSDPSVISRSMMTVRFLRRRDRIWHIDRPIVFELRPVNPEEAYEMEAGYWRSLGDDRRAELAHEICDRIRSTTAVDAGGPSANSSPSDTLSKLPAK
jgi:hypothetical protein